MIFGMVFEIAFSHKRTQENLKERAVIEVLNKKLCKNDNS